jgi:hypothetical protein
MLCIAALALAALAPAHARAAENDDEGTLLVSHRGQFLGIEDFVRHNNGVSLIVDATARQLLPNTRGTVDSLTKVVSITLGAEDGDLKDYQSREFLGKRYTRRQLSMSDTTYTSYRLEGVGGFGDTYAKPPGRLYVIDPQVFVLFDVLSHDLSQQTFDERPITFMYITGDRDSAVEARVKRLGSDPVRLGNRSYPAEKFEITDPWSLYYLWAAPKTGRMLKFTLPSGGLDVVRDPATLSGEVFGSGAPLAPAKSGAPKSAAKPKPGAGAPKRSAPAKPSAVPPLPPTSR